MRLDETVSVKSLGFEAARFWSSPDLVPAKNVIANVIANPNHHDLAAVADRFGIEALESVFNIVEKEPGVRPAALRISRRWLNSARQ